MKKVRINVKGRVQGVGFRYTTKLLADRLGVTGTVKNELDGSVSIEAVGEESIIDAFLEAVRASPSPVGMVSEMSVVSDSTMPNFTSFRTLN